MLKIFTFILSTILSVNAIADSNDSYEITPPFINVPVNTDSYTGLNIFFDVVDNEAQDKDERNKRLCRKGSKNCYIHTNKKLECQVFDFYKGWFEARNVSGEPTITSTYGDYHTIIFTYKKPTKTLSQNVDQYHLNAAKTYILANHLDYVDKTFKGTVTCYYLPETDSVDE